MRSSMLADFFGAGFFGGGALLAVASLGDSLGSSGFSSAMPES